MEAFRELLRKCEHRDISNEKITKNRWQERKNEIQISECTEIRMWMQTGRINAKIKKTKKLSNERKSK